MASVKITRDLLRTLKPGDKPYEVRDSDCAGFVVRVHPSGRMKYAVRYARGKQYTIGPVDGMAPDEARKRATAVIADYTRGIDHQEEKRQARAKRDVPTLGEYLDGDYGEFAKTHYSDGTEIIKRMKSVFADLLTTKMDQVTAWEIEKWRVKRMKDGVKASTLNRQLNPLKAMFNRAVEFGVLETNPLAGAVKLKKVDKTPIVRYLSDDEEARLLSALRAREARKRAERASANKWRKERGYPLLPNRKTGYADHLLPMVLVSMHTGVRRGELFNLRWPEVDFKQRILTVLGEGAKSGETRHIPLNDVALQALQTWRDDGAFLQQPVTPGTGYVFPGEDGGRLRAVRTAWEEVLENAKVTEFRWHDLRHTFASRLVMAGVDLNTVRELLGHGDLKMTIRYAHLAPHVKADAVARLVQTPVKAVKAG